MGQPQSQWCPLRTVCQTLLASPSPSCNRQQAARLPVGQQGRALSFHCRSKGAQSRQPPAEAAAGSVQRDGVSLSTRARMLASLAACVCKQGCTPRRLAARARLCACLHRGGCFALLPSSGVAAACPLLCGLALVQAALRTPLAPAQEARHSSYRRAGSQDGIWNGSDCLDWVIAQSSDTTSP